MYQADWQIAIRISFEQMNKSGTVRVSQNVSMLTQSHVLEGMGGALDTSASLIVEELNYDIDNELIISGLTGLGALRLYVYSNIVNNTNEITTNAITYGSVSIIDYSKINNDSIVLIGDSSGNPISKILRKI